MMPGFPGRTNPRQMDAMMKRLGIHVEEIEDVEEVVIRTKTRDLVFKDASVTVMKAQGATTYQLTGTAVARPRAGAPAAPAAPAEKEAEQQLAEVKLDVREEDVALVAEQTGKSKAEARQALEAAKGDIAEAIVKLGGG